MRRPLTVLAAAVVLVLLAATPKSILDSYRLAIASRKIPANMEFDYTVTKSGPARIVTEQHRVYWTSSGEERNDTISVNGTPVIPARSQMLHRTVWPYDAGQFAVTAEDYDATPAGMAIIASRRTYAFALARNTPADFMLKSTLCRREDKVADTRDVCGRRSGLRRQRVNRLYGIWSLLAAQLRFCRLHPNWLGRIAATRVQRIDPFQRLPIPKRHPIGRFFCRCFDH